MLNTMLNLRYSQRTAQKLLEEERNSLFKWDDIMEKYQAEYPCIYTNGNIEEKKIALTFDDAPDAECTPVILDILNELKVQACFSAIGLHIEKDLKIFERICKENHAIINHTYLHPDLSLIKSKQVKEEILRTEKLIYNISHKKTKLMRPPYGKISEEALKAIMELDYKVIMWSYNTYDYVATQEQEIYDGMMDKIRPGEIILMHSYENKGPTVKALKTIITDLRKKGFEFVSVSELLDIDCWNKIF